MGRLLLACQVPRPKHRSDGPYPARALPEQRPAPASHWCAQPACTLKSRASMQAILALWQCARAVGVSRRAPVARTPKLWHRPFTQVGTRRHSKPHAASNLKMLIVLPAADAITGTMFQLPSLPGVHLSIRATMLTTTPGGRGVCPCGEQSLGCPSPFRHLTHGVSRPALYLHLCASCLPTPPLPSPPLPSPSLPSPSFHC